MEKGVVLGPYRIVSELGSGGMGKVYAATLTRDAAGLAAGATVALKVVHPHLLETEGFFKRFLREAQIGQSVSHENVVRTLDCDAVGGHHFLVMEYVEGQTLRELLRELGQVPEELCRHVGREVAKALAAVHAAGVVHRDVKPENVLITPDHTVKVMDLGVARLTAEAVRLSQTGAFVGSIHYSAPECFGDGSRHVDGRADLHALGLVLYELACGTNPYVADGIPQIIGKVLHEDPRRLGDICPQLSPLFEEVVHTLLAKDPEDRFASCDEVHAVLEQGEESAWWRARATAIRVKTQRPLRRIRIPRETGVYGRDKELAQIRGLFARATASAGQVLLIEGEAGIGKSRLVDELIIGLQREGQDLNFLFGSYPPGGAATAAGGFSTAYREQFGDEGSAGYLGRTPVLVPAFDALLRGEPMPDTAQALTVDTLQTCFVNATRALAAERVSIVLIDDLHFAPKEGLALFAALAMAVPGHRVLLIGTTRPGTSEQWLSDVTRLDHAGLLELPRLGPKDLMALLSDALGSERLAHELAGQIATKSDGNPFFVFEILRGLRDGEFITRQEDGSWVTTKVIEELRIPSSVMDLVNARVAGLGEEQRDLLDVASCWGFEFDATLIGDAMGLGRIPTLKQCARIEKVHRLIRCAGERFVFDHHQVQEALYGALPPQLRREYHATLATALETRAGAVGRVPEDLDGALCVEMCEHFLEGGLGESATRYLDAALQHLAEGHLLDQAVRLAERALAVPDLVRGEERLDLLLRHVWRLDVLGHRDAERRALDEALALAEADGRPALRARVETEIGWLLIGLSRYDEAHDALTRAVALSQEAGDKVQEAHATGNLGTVLLHEGRYSEARLHYERRLALATEVGSRLDEAAAMGNLGAVDWFEGRYDDAREHFDRYLTLSRETGNVLGEISAGGNLASVLLVQGHYDTAREHYEAIGALAREIGDRQGEAGTLNNLGPLYIVMGRPGLARERVLASRDICREMGLRRVEGHALEYLADAARALGDLDESERLYREALALRRDIGSPHDVATVLVDLGAALAAAGRTKEAVAALREGVQIAEEAGLRSQRAIGCCRLAALSECDVAEARAAVEEHDGELVLLERMECRFLLWKVDSNPADLAAARSILHHIRDHAPEDCRDTMIENVSLHRDIVAAWKAHGGDGEKRGPVVRPCP
jgi:tetratricopeptide (TPR) repeat protein